MARILIVDDHEAERDQLAAAATAAGHDVQHTAHMHEAMQRIQDTSFDLLVSDVRVGGGDGLEILRTARAVQPATVVMVTADGGSVSLSVDAMRIGAADFVSRPFGGAELALKIERLLDHRRRQYEVAYLRHTQPEIYDFDRIVGASGALRRVLDVVRKVAKSNATVLIHGETGTGKELIAGALHHNSSRAARSFVKVNCAALQENLLESELFGHEKGAFTGADRQRIGRFEQADGGSLFLDEVGDMNPSTQAKILRVLQEHEFERLGGPRTIRVDVRMVAATNRNLASMVASGLFREDLFYRLNVASIEMPPLRERKEDVPALVGFFVRRFAAELKKRVEGIEPDAMKVLLRYNWPGNIRELENTIERAVLLAERRAVRCEDLRIDGAGGYGRIEENSLVKIPPTGAPLEEIERTAVIEALKMSNWVQKDAAELLSISPRVMNYKIKVLKIRLPQRRPAHQGLVGGVHPLQDLASAS